MDNHPPRSRPSKSHAILIAVIASLTCASSVGQEFVASANMTSPRYRHTATLLGNDRVLVAGGESGLNPVVVTDTAEIYNLSMDRWSPVSHMVGGPRFMHTATLLRDGRVLVVGGGSHLTNGASANDALEVTATADSVGIPNGGSVSRNDQLATAEVYDPRRNTWTAVAPIPEPRIAHTATLLRGRPGRVLVVGGAINAPPRVYDPATNTWSRTQPPLTGTRYYHTATQLLNGQVLVVGGTGDSAGLNSAEVYNPQTNNWSPAGTLSTPRFGHTATLLPTGQVVVAGGWRGSDPLDSAEVYDPATNSWSRAGTLKVARALPVATFQAGRVVVAGGNGPRPSRLALNSAEQYDPATNTWTLTGPLTTPRGVATAVTLRNGKFFVTGGIPGRSPASVLSSTELR